MDLLRSLSSGDPSDGVSRQIDAGDRLGRGLSKIRMRSTLNDSEEALLIRSSMRLDTSLEPVRGSVDGYLEPLAKRPHRLGVPFIWRPGGRAVVEGHDDVRSEIVLDLHRPFRSKVDLGTIDDGFEGDAFVVDGIYVSH